MERRRSIVEDRMKEGWKSKTLHVNVSSFKRNKDKYNPSTVCSLQRCEVFVWRINWKARTRKCEVSVGGRASEV